MSDPRLDMTRRTAVQRRIVLCMYFSYVAVTFAKLALGVSAGMMMEDPTLQGFDLAVYGRIAGWASIGAVVGKLVNGALADRIGGRRTFLLVLSATIALCVGIGSSSGVFALGLLFGLSQFVKSACWPAMADQVNAWVVPERYGSVWGVLSNSSRMGTMGGLIVLGWMLTTMHWRTLFYSVGGLVALNLLATWLWMTDRPEDVGLASVGELLSETPDAEPAPPHPLDGTSLAQGMAAFAASKRVWLICLSVGFLTVLMQAFTDFLPAFLKQSLSLADGHAGMASSAFPFGCLVSVLLAGFVYDRLSSRGKRNLLTATLIASMGCVALLAKLPTLGLEGTEAVVVSMAVLTLFGILVSPAYYLPMAVFATEFGGPHRGVLIGLIDAAGYLVAAGFSFIAGDVAQRHGWGAFLLLVGACNLISMVLIFLFTHGEVKRQEALEALA